MSVDTVKTIRQKILEQIETTLAGITTQAGYQTNFKASQISRSAIGIGRENIWPSILISVADNPSTITTSMTGDVVTREMTVDLTLSLGGAINVMPTQVEEAIGDILKAMAVDPTRGGHACETSQPEIREPTYSQIMESMAFVTISYPITYQHQRTDAAVA